MFTIAPRPRATILGAAARQVANTVPRCTSIRSRNSSAVTVRIDEPAGSAVPAQFTSASIAPKCLSHKAISSSATVSSAADPAWGTARPPAAVMAATVDSTALASRPLTTTPAPHSASLAETAAPIPRDPPATTTPNPSSGRSLTGGGRLGT